MLRSRNKLTGEDKTPAPQSKERGPEPTEGDCRECAFYTAPVSTGLSEDIRFLTANFRMRPCGKGACVGKKFMTRDDLKALQDKPRKEVPVKPAPKPKSKPKLKKNPAKKKTGLGEPGKPDGSEQE